MEFGWLGLIELFVALMFVSAWGCLELYTKRFDKRSAEQERGARAAIAVLTSAPVSRILRSFPVIAPPRSPP